LGDDSGAGVRVHLKQREQHELGSAGERRRGMTAVYHIGVQGHLDADWSEEFAGLSIIP
jgi:hypothetical protein